MTKKQDERTKRILAILARNKKADVTELSDQLGVSMVTIRKDLDELERKGFIIRKQGYAELNESDDISSRLAYHYGEKRRIARKAAELISDGDTIMIESGSCCALLADILGTSGKRINIITNSCFIADYVRHHGNIEVTLLAGQYQKESQCLVGPMIRETADNFHVSYFFIGTDGYSETTGFTNRDPLRAQAVRDMAHSADTVIILTESNKFSVAGTNPLNIKNRNHTVITDSSIPEAMMKSLAEKKIEVMIAA